LTNYKHIDLANLSGAGQTGAVPAVVVADYRHSLASDSAYSFRSFSTQYQIGHPKALSDWISYFSNYSEIWSFFLIFYAIALTFFFFLHSTGVPGLNQAVFKPSDFKKLDFGCYCLRGPLRFNFWYTL
jgi:hypothetical protein